MQGREIRKVLSLFTSPGCCLQIHFGLLVALFMWVTKNWWLIHAAHSRESNPDTWMGEKAGRETQTKLRLAVCLWAILVCSRGEKELWGWLCSLEYRIMWMWRDLAQISSSLFRYPWRHICSPPCSLRDTFYMRDSLTAFPFLVQGMPATWYSGETQNRLPSSHVAL